MSFILVYNCATVLLCRILTDNKQYKKYHMMPIIKFYIRPNIVVSTLYCQLLFTFAIMVHCQCRTFVMSKITFTVSWKPGHEINRNLKLKFPLRVINSPL